MKTHGGSKPRKAAPFYFDGRDKKAAPRRPKFNKYDMYMTVKGKTWKSPSKFYLAKEVDAYFKAQGRKA